MSQFYSYPPTAAGSVPAGAATAANQVLEISDLDAIKASTASIDTKLSNPLPVSAASLPLPSGASTSALQTSGNASLSSIDSKLTNPLPVSIAASVTVTGPLTDTQLRASAVPVSAASLPLPAGAATAANQATANTSLSSIDGKTPALGQALAASSVPVVLTAAQLSTLTPLSSVSVSNFPVTQPISGTVTANAGSGTFAISAAALPLPTGASTSALQSSTITALGSPFQAGGSIGNTSFIATQATGTNLHTVVDSISGTVAVSAASLPLPTGAATSANQTTANTSLSSIDTKTPALGQALAASSVPVVLTASQLTTLTPLSSVTVTQATGTNLHAVIDSGTITANAGSGTFAISAASLPLPAGAATSANQTTANTSLSSIDTKTPALGQALAASSVPVVLTAAQLATLTPLSTVTVTQAGKAIANASVYNDYTSTSVTTAAYVQLVASTTLATSEIEIFDSSGQGMILAVGAAASEVDQIFIFPGGNGRVPLKINASSRVSIKAKTATASVGYIMINFYA